VAGGGVGAIETVLALRALAGHTVAIDLVAPGDEFIYRPLVVTEPFGYAPALRLPLARLADTHDVRVHRAALEAVLPAEKSIRLSGATTLSYDYLVVAVGGRGKPWLPGALTFTGAPDGVDAYRALLDELEAGDVSRLLFAVPPGAAWALPTYELALLTAAWEPEHGVIGAELAFATPEQRPLEVFGLAAARAVSDLFGDRGIALHCGAAVASFSGERVELTDGIHIEADRVVTLPQVGANPVDGLPQDDRGFIPIDDYAAVLGLEDVWAVGDATSFPIKQGGLATQQADAAAAAVAERLGAAAQAEPFAPVMRGLLLTGVTSAYLRADLGNGSGAAKGEAAFNSLWWPPSKIAGRYLAPYLAGQSDLAGVPELHDRAPAGIDERARVAHEEQRRLALELADADANWGDHRSALRWLQTVEWLDGALGPELADRRARWEAELRQSR
jgi:sulfide:quinone oxidoreductase